MTISAFFVYSLLNKGELGSKTLYEGYFPGKTCVPPKETLLYWLTFFIPAAAASLMMI